MAALRTNKVLTLAMLAIPFVTRCTVTGVAARLVHTGVTRVVTLVVAGLTLVDV